MCELAFVIVPAETICQIIYAELVLQLDIRKTLILLVFAGGLGERGFSTTTNHQRHLQLILSLFLSQVLPNRLHITSHPLHPFHILLQTFTHVLQLLLYHLLQLLIFLIFFKFGFSSSFLFLQCLSDALLGDVDVRIIFPNVFCMLPISFLKVFICSFSEVFFMAPRSSICLLLFFEDLIHHSISIGLIIPILLPLVPSIGAVLLGCGPVVTFRGGSTLVILFFGILSGQDLIGFIEFLEKLLFALIGIRMILFGKLDV